LKEIIDNTTNRTTVLIKTADTEKDTYDTINHFTHVDRNGFGIDAVIVN